MNFVLVSPIIFFTYPILGCGQTKGLEKGLVQNGGKAGKGKKWDEFLVGERGELSLRIER
jgi:hypothetical protein